MACGCGKKTNFTQAKPLVLGNATGASPTHFRSTISLNGLRPGAEFWATGDGVAAMAANKWIISID